MAPTRIKSSFIYLGNAVNDLRGNWTILAVVLAPLVIAASLCLLPEALNLQHRLASSLGGGMTTVGYFLAQEPYHPATGPVIEPYPEWLVYTLRGVGALVTLAAGLVVLVELRRIQGGDREHGVIAETIAVYKSAGLLALAYLWIAILQLLAPIVAVLILEFAFSLAFTTQYPAVSVLVSVLRFALLLGAAVVYLWLYFAEFALVFGDQRSFHSLLHSRDLMRKRFYTVAIRIIVFLAVWSGYNSWAIAAFVIVSILLGPVAQLTGVVWTIVILLNVMWLGVSYATSAFFIAAGVRLYQDLVSIADTAPAIANGVAASMPPTMPLSNASA